MNLPDLRPGTRPLDDSLQASSGEYEARLEWIADLIRDALLSQARRDLELAYAAERLREMVRKEQDCCAFLTST